MSTTVVDGPVKCERCAHIGIDTLAVWDCPLPFGVWAYQCHAHYLRLPRACQEMAQPLEVSAPPLVLSSWTLVTAGER